MLDSSLLLLCRTIDSEFQFLHYNFNLALREINFGFCDWSDVIKKNTSCFNETKAEKDISFMVIVTKIPIILNNGSTVRSVKILFLAFLRVYTPVDLSNLLDRGEYFNKIEYH